MRCEDLRLLNHRAVRRHRPALILEVTRALPAEGGELLGGWRSELLRAALDPQVADRFEIDGVVALVNGAGQLLARDFGGGQELDRERAHKDVRGEFLDEGHIESSFTSEGDELANHWVGDDRGRKPLDGQLGESLQ